MVAAFAPLWGTRGRGGDCCAGTEAGAESPGLHFGNEPELPLIDLLSCELCLFRSKQHSLPLQGERFSLRVVGMLLTLPPCSAEKESTLLFI